MTHRQNDVCTRRDTGIFTSTLTNKHAERTTAGAQVWVAASDRCHGRGGGKEEPPLFLSLKHYCVQCKQATREEREACGWRYQRDKCICLVEPKGAELKMTWLLFVLSALTCSRSWTIENKRCSGSAENRHIQHTGGHESTIGETRGNLLKRRRVHTNTRTSSYPRNNSMPTISITLTGLTVLPYSNKPESRQFSCCPHSYDDLQLELYQGLQPIRFILVESVL